jgi:PAS domain S-box-containing protein
MSPENSSIQCSLLEEQLRVLCAANRDLNTQPSLSSISHMLVQYGQKLLNATAGAVGLLEDGQMVFREYFIGEECREINYSFKPGVGIPGWVTDHLEPYITHNAAYDLRVVSEIQQALGFTSLINVPIIDHENRLIGCLELHDKQGNKLFNEQDVEMLQGLAASAAIAMSNAIYTEKLQHKHAELNNIKERYRNLVESTSDWVWEVDHTGAYTYASPKLESLLGYQPSEVIGRTPFEFMSLGEAARVKHIFVNQIMKDEQPINRLVNVNQHKNGHEVILETSGVPFYDEMGSLMGYRGIDRDITDRINTQQVLLNAKTDAENANLAKSEFIFRMSHELRTPLNAILGFGQILEMTANDFNDQQKDNVKEILDAGHHLLKLINDVLDLAKIESGKLEVDIEATDVGDILQQCTQLVTSQLEESHIELIDNISHKKHTVQADPMRLKQVLLNLLTNAIKYNCCQGRVSLNSELINEQCLRIIVTDTGEGISEEELTKLFSPYERLNASNNIQGTGIGLSIAKHIIELMGGTIDVHSVVGEGSSFWIELPVS